MTTVDMIFFISRSLSGFVSGIYMFLQAIKYKADRLLLLLISAIILWFAIIYTFVALRILPFVGYGVYVRPMTFALLFVPTWIWMDTHYTQRKGKIKHDPR